MVIAWGRASDRIERGAIGAKAVSYHQKAGNKSSRETLANLRNDQVSATYRDGVLEIHVPKAEEAKVREIEVQVG